MTRWKSLISSSLLQNTEAIIHEVLRVYKKGFYAFHYFIFNSISTLQAKLTIVIKTKQLKKKSTLIHFYSSYVILPPIVIFYLLKKTLTETNHVIYYFCLLFCNKNMCVPVYTNLQWKKIGHFVFLRLNCLDGRKEICICWGGSLLYTSHSPMVNCCEQSDGVLLLRQVLVKAEFSKCWLPFLMFVGRAFICRHCLPRFTLLLFSV